MTKAKTKNIYQRMHSVMQKVTYVKKEKGGMQYSSVSHDAVTKKLRAACLEEGIVITQSVFEHRLEGNNTVCDVVVTITNIDDPADNLVINSFGYGIDRQDKGPGKAMSYAFKYALLKAFMLETGDDPDRDATTPDRAAKKSSPDKLPAAVFTGNKKQLDRLAKVMDEVGLGKEMTSLVSAGVMDRPLTQVREIVEGFAHGNN